jgi:hypothetical protein
MRSSKRANFESAEEDAKVFFNPYVLQLFTREVLSFDLQWRYSPVMVMYQQIAVEKKVSRGLRG